MYTKILPRRAKIRFQNRNLRTFLLDIKTRLPVTVGDFTMRARVRLSQFTEVKVAGTAQRNGSDVATSGDSQMQT